MKNLNLAILGILYGAGRFHAAAAEQTALVPGDAAGDDKLEGKRDTADVFDADAGGDDHLHGFSGDDTYLLGAGTDHDTIHEYDKNSGDDGDKIKVKSGYTPDKENVRLRRSDKGDHLLVELLNADGTVSDSLRVKNYYTEPAAKVESVEFEDSDTVWTAAEFALAPITGDAGYDELEGKDDLADVFDSDFSGSGDDDLLGYGGNDIYWLGASSGHDTIKEYRGSGEAGNAGDDGDMIKIKSGYAPSNVRLRRSDDGYDLLVELTDASGVVSSLKVEEYYAKAAAKVESVRFEIDGTVWESAKLDAARITGDGDADNLYGLKDANDVFDSSAGGDDILHGRSGDDTYWLGAGTGRDTIRERTDNTAAGDDGDVIKIKSGYTPANTRLRRTIDGEHLYVELLDTDGSVSDSLRVEHYYSHAAAKIERVEFEDSDTVWTASDFAAVRLTGTAAGESIDGSKSADVFDGNAGGDDILHGKSGDDVYWLGAGTDHDVIKEHTGNTTAGDDGDVIKIKSAYGADDVRLLRAGDDLVIQLLDAGGMSFDSLTVESYYTNAAAKVESVQFTDGSGTIWNAATLTAAGEIKGTAGVDTLGKQNSHDTLLGGGGDDVYTLQTGSGHDVIREHADNAGDSGDQIKVSGGTANVRLLSSSNDEDLIVQLLNAAGEVTDSLTVEKHLTADASAKVESLVFTDGTTWDSSVLALTKIKGTAADDANLQGKSDKSDVFDADAGGNDMLRGRSGNDVYWLGKKTGLDTIHEQAGNDKDGDAGDMIRIESGIAPADVRLRRSDNGNDLLVELAKGKDAAVDSLTVKNYYTSAAAKVESVQFADGTVWDASDFALAEITGGAGDDPSLKGKKDLSDVFDADFGGNDTLYGYSGDDVYRLGAGTGHDTIIEYAGNTAGDDGDTIAVKSGYAVSDVLLLRSNNGNDLLVALRDAAGAVTDSLRVKNYYVNDAAKVESLTFEDSDTVLGASDFALAQIMGDAEDNRLHGKQDMADVFDSDGGGKDTLYGRSGNDTYWLGKGTDDDIIIEHAGNSEAGDADDKIKIKSDYGADDVRLMRSNNGNDLLVQLVDAAGTVTDSLTVRQYYKKEAAKVESVEFADGTVWNLADMAATEVLGGSKADSLSGRQNVNDTLYGHGGNDTYWLGLGVGHDVIKEHYHNAGDTADLIRVNTAYKRTDVRLLRSLDGADLLVQLLGADGEVTDSLTVENHYTDASAKVESIVFSDGSTWDSAALALTKIRGAAADDTPLEGKSDQTDVFDSDAGGNDTLQGKSGNDVYWLGAGTGKDTIQENIGNDSDGDAGDRIRVKSPHSESDVRLRSSDDGNDLVIELRGADGAVTDSLTVEDYYTKDAAKVESVEFAGSGAVWDLADWVADVLGDSGDNNLAGRQNVNDTLQGGKGNDTYTLGLGSGHDVIKEHVGNDSDGDSGDKIKIKSGYGTADVRLLRSRDEEDLLVQLLDARGVVTDSLTVEKHFTDASAKVESVEFADGTVWGADVLALTEITGTVGNDSLKGKDNQTDVFDSDAGGDDTLDGGGGNDVYWLGAGTGADVIREYSETDEKSRTDSGDAGDIIRIKSGYKPADVRLRRSGYGHRDLVVELLGDKGAVSDSLTVERYYTDASVRVESVEFSDGTVWTAKDFALLEITGGADDDYLYGSSPFDDVFDSDAGGNDKLGGEIGNDVYMLGAGTDHDVIIDRGYDADDKIKIKSGYAPADVRLSRSGNSLLVDLLDDNGKATDSLTVQSHFTDASRKIGSIEAAGYVLFEDRYQGLIDELAAFKSETEESSFSSEDAIRAHYWAEKIKGTASNDTLEGRQNARDVLYGASGDDVYLLGAGTSHDVIREYEDHSGHTRDSGDAGDMIRIKSGYKPGDVRLRRSREDLYVELLDDEGAVSDSLRVQKYYTDASARVESVEFADGTVWTARDFALVEITGGAGDDVLVGSDNFDDVFDADAGGNDTLYGRSGNDVYMLGKGTGHDMISERIWWFNSGDAGDKIEIKSGYKPGDVRLRRSGYQNRALVVELLDDDGGVSDSLTVESYYTYASVRVESVEFADGTVWNEAVLTAAGEIKGTVGADTLPGKKNSNDTLYGYGGDDVYSLGKDSGHDVIREHTDNSGDDGDVIKIGSEYSADDVRLRRSRDGKDLHVLLLNAAGDVTDSLTVERHFTDASAKVESIEFADADSTKWDADAITAGAVIVGGAADEDLFGESGLANVFDSSGGGDDTLYGYSGNDVYWLGAGTGDDVIREYSGRKIGAAGDSGDKIKIKSGYAPGDVRLRRSGVNHRDLHVELLDADGAVSDSLTVEKYYTSASARIESVEFADGTVWTAKDFSLVEITGGAGDDILIGAWPFDDVFDADAGGNDTLYGRHGNDVYMLGKGTGRDVIREYYRDNVIGNPGDKIKIKSGYAPGDVRLRRSQSDLAVELLDADGAVSDSLTVEDYYKRAASRVESVEFADGTVWDAATLTAAGEIKGTAGADTLSGKQNSNDTLYGYGGDDVYSLGKDSGHDVIREHTGNTGDDGDKIKIVGSGYGTGDVRLLRSGNDLVVRLLDAGGAVMDSLTVENHYTDASAKIESIEAAGHVLRENQFQGLIDEIAAFTAGDSSFASLDAIRSHYWDEEAVVTSSNG